MIERDETFDGTWPYQPRFSSAPGFQMHYIDEGQGEPVVMLHGQPTWGYLYRNFVDPLAATHRVIVPDHMGFGKSETPQEREYTLQAHVENLALLIDDLDLRDITFVMQDWGARIGACYAFLNPDRVKRLCFINGVVPTKSLASRSPMTAASQGAPLTRWFQWIHDGVESGRTRDVLTSLGSTVLSVMKIIGFEKTSVVNDAWIRAYAAPFGSPAECKGALAFPLDAYFATAWPYASACAVAGQQSIANKPAMLVRGMKDFAITREQMVGAFGEVWPAAPVIELPNAGHYSQEDAPETIVALMQQFLQMTR